VLQIKEKDSLWHERLGQTYLLAEETKAAMAAFKTAQGLDDLNWRCNEGLAMAYAQEEDYSSAVQEMNKTIERLRNDDQGEKEERQKAMLRNLVMLAEWHTELHNSKDAMECYEKALEIKPDDKEIQFNLLKLLFRTDQDEQARKFLDGMAEKKSQDSDLSQLGAMLQLLIADDEYDVLFGMLFATVRGFPIFVKLMDEMQAATEFAKLERRTPDQAILLLYTGIATYHYDQSEMRNPEAALGLWDECGVLKTEDSPWRLSQTCRQAVRLMSSFHFHLAKSAPNPALHVEKLEQIVLNVRKYGEDRHTRFYLGCYHARVSADRDKAKGIFLNDMKEAVDLLSDEAEWNDYLGYYKLADIFMHYGDDLNALSAWSMLGPYDAGRQRDTSSTEDDDEGRYGPLKNNCDGRCGKSWTYANDFYCCQICPDVQLCDECLRKLKAGTVKRFVCSPEHEWLHVPKWDDDKYNEVGIHKILVGGTFERGVRVGGEPIPVEDWLNKIRDDWGIPRPEKREEEESNKEMKEE
jgi:tetratricopeptide (TPR) repeat protein